MLKATSGNTVILGLSKENLESLKAGGRFEFDGSEIGIPGKTFLIASDEHEFYILGDLRNQGLEIDPDNVNISN